jgi:hypothetical protein
VSSEHQPNQILISPPGNIALARWNSFNPKIYARQWGSASAQVSHLLPVQFTPCAKKPFRLGTEFSFENQASGSANKNWSSGIVGSILWVPANCRDKVPFPFGQLQGNQAITD